MSTAVSRAFLLAAALLPVTGLRAQFSDNFDDGDFTLGTLWTGDDALYTVVGSQLRSNSPGAANYHLSTPSSLVDDAQWEFFIDLKFSTSGANYADVYLMSSAADLASGVDGYFVRIGGTDDRVELFRSDVGTPVSLLVQSPDGVVNSSTANPFRIKVTRTAAALWSLYFDDGALGTYTLAGSATEGTYTTAGFFGIRIEQSSAGTPVNNHFFDDISAGPIPVDLTPPTLVSATVISDTQIDLAFSEAVEQFTAEEEANYDIIPFNSAASVVRDGTDLALVHLTLAIAMQSGNTYTITVNGVEDLAANACVNETTDVLYFVPDEALPGEVVINEIFADPTPIIGLPEAEFIEVFNATSNKTFDLADWTIGDGSSTGTFPSIPLTPGAFAILTDDTSAPQYAGFGTVVSIGSFPSLNNDGDPLELKDDNGIPIDAVTYSDAWYNDDIKADGGWTLERIDPTTPCSSTANWTASNDPQGGTPGEENSVFAVVPDLTAPTLASVQVLNATELRLLFNELLDATSTATATYTLAPSGTVIGVVNGPAPVTAVIVTLDAPLEVGVLYTITVQGVKDCPGNAIGAANTAQFALPEPVVSGDVVINEVLYDPRVDGYDFVELYNRSTKTLSLGDLALANEEDGQIANITPIDAADLLLPGQYVVITENPANIAAEYPLGMADRYLQADLPSFNNGEGSVVLLATAGDTLEIFRYNDDMHFELLNETEGASLERVDPARAVDDASNWHSASELVGWATPGYLNSQFSAAPSASGELIIDPAIFSPDNDGYQDVLTATYRFDEPGFTGTLKVFDLAGREERTILNNVLLGVEGAVSWDGILEDGSKGRIGPHIFVFEVFDLTGNVLRFRETVVLAHKLN